MRIKSMVLPEGPFQPAWDSLENYKVPRWYLDAKFGIFIHWGVYSVPAFQNEWYPRNMYIKGHQAYKHFTIAATANGTLLVWDLKGI